jgi:hypothetical protein
MNPALGEVLMQLLLDFLELSWRHAVGTLHGGSSTRDKGNAVERDSVVEACWRSKGWAMAVKEGMELGDEV